MVEPPTAPQSSTTSTYRPVSVDVPFVPGNTPASFEKVAGVATGQNFTSVTVGPDGKLYAATLEGLIIRYTIAADGTLTSPQTITSLQAANGGNRMLMGMDFDPAATAANPILWVTHSAYVLANIRVNSSAIWGNAAWTGLFAIGAHVFCRWLYAERNLHHSGATNARWRIRWTVVGLFLLFLSFAAGTSVVALVHQFILMRGPEFRMYAYMDRFPEMDRKEMSHYAAEAMKTGRGILELVREQKILTEEQIRTVLDPAAMTGQGHPG